MSNPVMSFIADGAAATTSGFTHEDVMTLILVTIPTMILAVVTMWDNDHMYKVAMKALERLRPSRSRLVTRVRHTGRHLRAKGQPSWSDHDADKKPKTNATKISADANLLSKLEQAVEGTEQDPEHLGMDPEPAK